MITHEDIRAALSGAGSVDPHHPEQRGLTLVARYQDERLELPGGRALVFLPDMHLLTEADARQFPQNHFEHKTLIMKFMSQLRDLKVAFRGEVSVIHIGDVFDLWRCRGGLSTDLDAAQIAAEYEEFMTLLRSSPPKGVRATILAGNHDYELHNLSDWMAPRFLIVENNDRAAGDILITHGDSFDWLESLPDPLQKVVVRLARWVKAGHHELDADDAEAVATVNRALRPGDTTIGDPRAELGSSPATGATSETFNVVAADRGPANAKNKRFYKQAVALAEELEKKHGHKIRAIVIGHTHWARIVAGERPARAPFALVDCGAWFGQCRLSKSEPWQWCAQVGVILGNDIRIYQVGYKPLA